MYGEKMKSRASKATVVLADDDSAMLSAVHDLLEHEFDILAMVDDGEKVFKAVAAYSPDLILLDIGMPRMTGIQAALQLQKAGFTTKLVFLTSSEDPEFVRAVSELGGSYVLKRRMMMDLKEAIHQTLAGKLFCSHFRSGDARR
jgi:DNA-binding NarL/FixJ family response regulator